MNVLETHDLRKGFESRGKRIEAVRGVSLSIAPGEILAFLGRNGSGKTTTIKMTADLIEPDSGTVFINGRNPRRDPQVKASVGAVLEGSRNLYGNLTARQNLIYWGGMKGLSRRECERRTSDLLCSFELADKANAKVQDLSRGMQQKVALSVSLLTDPDLLLLDEPTLGLDPESTIAIQERLQRLAKEGCAVLLTTHQIDVAQRIAHRVVIIEQGEIILEDSMRAVVEKFSGTSYTIEVEGQLDASRTEALTAQGAVVDGNAISFYGERSGIYGILDIVRPMPLVKAARTEADLASIFLKLTNAKERRHD
jgi:ABC-2 type transport system ATP-binding protein